MEWNSSFATLTLGITSARMADNKADGLMEFKPIGYLRSIFQYKNGTPRQPSLCSTARGTLTIEKSVFNNPDHALEGLEQFSHAWIVFVFHKNTPGHTKAKVKPPRLNGKRVGVFSTRSPYRPNAIGLTLSKIERVSGSTIHVSGVDIVDGTPVLDIKPFIPDYDIPACRGDSAPIVTSRESRGNSVSDEHASDSCIRSCGLYDEQESVSDRKTCDADSVHGRGDRESKAWEAGEEEKESISMPEKKSTKTGEGGEEANSTSISHELGPSDMTTLSQNGMHTLEEQDAHLAVSEPEVIQRMDIVCKGPGKVQEISRFAGKLTAVKDSRGEGELPPPDSDSSSSSCRRPMSVAGWLSAPPVRKLRVSFTSRAASQLQKFAPQSGMDTDSCYKLDFLSGAEDVRAAIVSVLSEDPRSVYRREKCRDALYFFTVDQVHVTCWFDEVEHCAEVVQLQPLSFVEKLMKKL